MVNVRGTYGKCNLNISAFIKINILFNSLTCYMVYYSKIISYHIISSYRRDLLHVHPEGGFSSIHQYHFLFYLEIDPVQSKTIVVIPGKLESLLGVLSLTCNGRLGTIIFEFKIPDAFREGWTLQGLKAEKKLPRSVWKHCLSHQHHVLASRSLTCCRCLRTVPMGHSLAQEFSSAGGGVGLPTAMAQVCMGYRMLIHLLKILLFKIQIIW